MNLFEINSEYKEILDNLYDENGEIDEKELIKLEQNEMTMEKKAISIASYIKNLDAEREAIANAKKAMLEREKRCKKKIDDLEGYLLAGMESRGLKSVKCPFFEIALKLCPLSVDDDELNMDELPDKYKRTKIEVSPNKVLILQDMKAGMIIPGASLKRGLRLDIK